MTAARPRSTMDLLASERLFLAAIQQVGFGRFEYLQIRHREVVLDPWPVAVRDVKFGVEPSGPDACESPAAFDLKRQFADFFEYTRSVDAGEIRTLEIRHGLPFSMEIELAASRARGGRS